jgi:hypothetical protein
MLPVREGAVSRMVTTRVLPHLISEQLVEHGNPLILQIIQPSSHLHFPRDIRVHPFGILLKGPRRSSSPMGFE